MGEYQEDDQDFNQLLESDSDDDDDIKVDEDKGVNFLRLDFQTLILINFYVEAWMM